MVEISRHIRIWEWWINNQGFNCSQTEMPILYILLTSYYISMGFVILKQLLCINLHSQRQPLEALANTRPSVSSKTRTEDRLESVESKELCGGEFFRWWELKKSGATEATSSRKLRLSMAKTRAGNKNNWSIFKSVFECFFLSNVKNQIFITASSIAVAFFLVLKKEDTLISPYYILFYIKRNHIISQVFQILLFNII